MCRIVSGGRKNSIHEQIWEIVQSSVCLALVVGPGMDCKSPVKNDFWRIVLSFSGMNE